MTVECFATYRLVQRVFKTEIHKHIQGGSDLFPSEDNRKGGGNGNVTFI